MNLALLLMYSVGEIRPNVFSSKQTLYEVWEYHKRNPSLNSLLDVLNHSEEAGHIPKVRYVLAPKGHNIQAMAEHIRGCGGGSYSIGIKNEPFTINDFFTYNDATTSITNGLTDLKSAIHYFIRRTNDAPNVSQRLEMYIVRYTNVMLLSLFRHLP